jgi:site-specific DNA recombinase
MLLQIQGVFAEYERALIKERTRRGRLFSARQGKVNWGGNPPYGFNYARKTDVMPQQVSIDLSEAAVVRKMYQWLVEEQLSSYAIQRRLVEQETPTRKQNTQGWAQSSVVKILSSSIYKGETFYNRTHYVDVKRARGKAGYKDLRPGNLKGRANRPREEWIKVSVPVIIDPELWQMAQHQLAINRERAKKNNSKHDYLLRGLLICGCCQRRLIGVWSRASNSRYVCSARFPRTNSWSCSGRSISGEQVESSVSENFRIVVAWT